MNRYSIIVFSLLCLCFSCKKQEPFYADAPRIINLVINGSTTEALEFVYKDSVIAEGAVNNGFYFSTKLKAGSGDEVLKIRKKGSSEILGTRMIRPSPYNQAVNVFYDGNKVYSNAVSYRIKGYAMTGEIEFLLDGHVVASGSGVIDKTVFLGIDQSGSREMQVRKKDETAVLLTRNISASPAEQSLKFFFDGTSIVDNVELKPPANPANMSVTAQFKTILPDMFLGGEVDVVFYIYNNITDEYSKPVPELRFAMPGDGSFTTFELPALPNVETHDYRMVILRRGTNIIPFDPSSIGLGSTVIENNGRFSEQIRMEPGKSKMWLINDYWNLEISPEGEFFFLFSGGRTDLSQYFQ